MKRTLIFVLSAIFCMALFAGCTQTPAEPEHEHTLVHNEAVAPSCEKSGMMEYWCCSECDACFSDAEGTTEVAIADLEVKALGHTAGDDDGDCTTAVDCTVCGKTAVAAKSHVAGQDDVDCTTAVKCANCEKNAIEANASHTPDEDDGDCTTAVKCANCEQIVTAGADAHTPGEDDGDCTTAVKCANCEQVVTAGADAHIPGEDDGDCTTAVKCANCEQVVTAGADAHIAGNDDGDCTTPVKCVNCDMNAIDAKSHVAGSDDGDCTTAVKCTKCEQIVTPGADAHIAGQDDGDCTTAVKCVNCEKNAIEANAVHTPDADDGDCTTAVKCANCEKNAIEAKDHMFVGNKPTCENCSAQNPNYVPELQLPEGAVLIKDYSSADSYFNNPHFGDGARGTTNWYEVLDGVAGVQAFGFQENQAEWFTQFGGLLPDFDYSGYTHVTFRIYVKSGKLRLFCLSGTPEWGTNLLELVTEFDTWTTVTIPVSKLSGTAFIMANVWGRSGDMIFIDQVYAQNKASELAVPEGAELVKDYSSAGSYFNNPDFGSGAKGTTKWYEEYEGVAGVQAFGFQENQAEYFTIFGGLLPDKFDYSGYTHITFRIYVKSGAFRGIWLSGTPEWGTNLLDLVTEFDTWTTVTIPVSKLSGTAVILANTWGRSGDSFFVDQVYVTTQASDVQ